MAISLDVNGTVREVAADPDTPLLYVLRNDLGLVAAKEGCGRAECGACAVLIDGREARACATPVGSLAGARIVTLEGLGTKEAPHPLQTAFVEEQAAHCGYCTSGMIVGAKGLLDRTPNPDDAKVRAALSGHLCRCGSHNRIVRAVLRVAKAMRRP